MTTLKLERDKKYVTARGEIITIVATGMNFLQGKSCIGVKGVGGIIPHNQCVHFKEDGTGPVLQLDHIVKEYREPRVISWDVVLFEDKRELPGTVITKLLSVGYGPGEWLYLKELSRQTVTFTVES